MRRSFLCFIKERLCCEISHSWRKKASIYAHHKLPSIVKQAMSHHLYINKKSYLELQQKGPLHCMQNQVSSRLIPLWISLICMYINPKDSIQEGVITRRMVLLHKPTSTLFYCILVFIFPKRLLTYMTTQMSCTIYKRLPMYGFRHCPRDITCTGLDTALEISTVEVRPT